MSPAPEVINGPEREPLGLREIGVTVPGMGMLACIRGWLTGL
jgi:hypothetical protein